MLPFPGLELPGRTGHEMFWSSWILTPCPVFNFDSLFDVGLITSYVCLKPTQQASLPCSQPPAQGPGRPRGWLEVRPCCSAALWSSGSALAPPVVLWQVQWVFS